MSADRKKAGWQAGVMLAELIRINTTNPPGNETKACRYLAKKFDQLGMEHETVEPGPGRGSIVARWRAKRPRAGPLLLLSHLDVVPADPEGWSGDPFSGQERDGFIYGRGAVDCKNATASQWFALKTLKESGFEPGRDIIMAATADEEAGGELGVSWIVRNRPELLEAQWCINEGGGFGVSLGEGEVYFCQTAEKGVCWLKLVATGETGHASVPRPGSAMERMVKALAELMSMNQAARVSGLVRKMALAVARAAGHEIGSGDLADERVKEVLEASAKSKELRRIFQALTTNTLAVTVISGGNKANVVPARVEATIDCRLVPGYAPEKLRKEIERVVGPHGVSVEPMVTSAATEMESEGELYEVIEGALKRARPGAELAPFMMPGGTDGRFLAEKGVKVYGFIPMLAEPGGGVSLLDRAHGADERIGMADLSFAVQVLSAVIEEFCARR